MYAKNSFSWQLGTFKLVPWKYQTTEIQEDLKITSCFAGWLFIQLRWFLVD